MDHIKKDLKLGDEAEVKGREHHQEYNLLGNVKKQQLDEKVSMRQLVLLPNSLALVDLLRKTEDGAGADACKGIELPVLIAEEAIRKVEKGVWVFDLVVE